MVNAAGIPMGMKMVLEECGINPAKLKADDMRTILANHDDFHNNKKIVECLFSSIEDIKCISF